MNFNIVCYLLGRLCMACVMALGVPLVLAVFFKEAAWEAFVLTITVGIVLGLVFLKLGKMEDERITFREGVAVVGCGWIVITMLGALPYVFTGTLDPVSAFFESVSGFTTTGATTISALATVPLSVIFWRSLTHWLGGIGIIVIFIALLPHVGSGIVHMFNAEVTGPSAERVLPRIKTTAAALCKIYVLFTAIEMVLLYFAGMSVFDAVTNSFSTVATGGFANNDASIVAYHSPLIEGIIAFFMIVAGGNFALYYMVSKKGWRTLWEDTEFKFYILIIAIITGAISLNLFCRGFFNGVESFRYAVFQVASIISTTGFVSNDFDVWPAFSKLCLILLMFIGGCAGSTAGGIKVTRIVILCKLALAELKRVIHPSMVAKVTMNGKQIPDSIIAGITRFFFLYVVLFAFFTFLMVATGLTVMDSIGVISATISSVGPALGVAGATCTYATITPFGKLVICAAMLLGRLELFTLMVLLRPEFWRSTRNW
ncbi:MAG: TrkH family potassium uptake protein [Acidaminococcaceae bacterium]